jgi:putative endonuclease
VYILKCADGTFYTGHTNNINARIGLHRSGRGAKYVRSRLPFRLVFRKSYRYFKAAFAEEFRIKALSRREKMELIKTMVRRHSVAR